MSLRDLDIKIDIDVNMSELLRANSAVESFKANIGSIQDELNIRLNLNDSDAMRGLRELREEMRIIDRSDIDIDINTDFERTLSDLNLLGERINALDNEDIVINTNLRSASSEIIAMRQHLRVLELQASHINVDLDTAGAHAQLAALQAHINGVRGPNLNSSGAKSGFNDMMSFVTTDPRSMALGIVGKIGIITALMPLLPALASTINVAIGAVGALGVALGTLSMGTLGLASALGVAGVGLFGFGATAVSTISALYEENAKLTAEQKRLKVQTDSVVDAWGNFKEALQPITFDAITTGVKTVNSLLKEGLPIVKNAGKGVSELFTSLNKSIEGNEVQDFFNMVKNNVKPLTLNIGRGLGDALKGVMNLMVAMTPLTNWMGKGFEGMMGSFSKWTEGLKTSKEFKGTMDYVKENFGKIGNGLLDLGKGTVNFFRGFSGISSDGFTWFENKMDQFSNWSANLGTNQGFQNFLKDIQTNAPLVGGILKDIGSSVKGFWKMLTDDGAGESVLSKISEITKKISNFTNDPAVQKIMNGALKLDFSQVFSGLGDWFKTNDFASGLVNTLSSVIPVLDSVIGAASTSLMAKFNIGKIFADSIENSNMPGVLKSAIGKIGLEDTINDALGVGGIDTSKIAANVISQTQAVVSGAGINAGQTFQSNFLSSFQSTNIPPVKIKTETDTTNAMSEINSLSSLLPKVDIKANMDTTNAKTDVAGLTDLIPKVNVKTDADITGAKTAISGIKDQVGPIKLPVSPLMNANGGNAISFKWPALPKFSWPKLPKFSWPKLPKFSWPKMPKFSWPTLPKWSWPAFPKFSWPPMPTVRVAVSGGKTDGSHANGLGRVNKDGYTATLHKDEAVLQAHNADLLRRTGILSGDGTNPTIDLSAQSGTTQTVATTNNTSNGVQVHAPVTVIVQGGQTNSETGNAVVSALENFFADMRDVFPAVREV